MIRQFSVIVAAVLLVPASHVRAQIRDQELRGGDLINDVDQSTVALHPATPYIESSTAVLADVDLEKIDVEATFEWLRETMGGGPKNDQAVMMVRGFIDSLKGAGTKHIFATAATRSMVDGGPLVIVPCDNPTVVNGLATVIVQNTPPEPAQKIHVGDRVVIAGAATAIDRVTETQGVQRPDLILPLRRGERLDHTIVISLPDEARSDLVALWPERMPAESPVQFSPRALAADVSSVVISWQFPPDPMMWIHIDTPHTSAAERVETALKDVLALAGDASSVIEMSVDVATIKLRASPDAFAVIAKQLAAPSRTGHAG